MKIELLGQFGKNCTIQSIGSAIESTIINEHHNYTTFRAYSAFATRSKVSKLTELLSSHGNLNTSFYIGVDQGGTSVEALEALLHSGFSTSIIYTTSNFIFHPKIYIFEGKEECRIILGSSNLTDSGFLKNIEANIAINLKLSEPDDLAFYEELNTALSSLSENEKVLTKGLIKLLLDSGIVPPESKTRKAYSKSPSASQINLLKQDFPSIERSVGTKASDKEKETSKNKKISVPTPEEKLPSLVHKFWFETGLSTGGSRNILDISISSHDNIIPGASSLFGLPPSEVRHNYENTTLLKRISIDYEGVTFKGNDIIYPVSKVTGKSNGSLRLSLRGVSDSGIKFTKLLNNGEQKGFVNQVCIFTYMDTDHYKMELFDHATHIKDIESKSIKIDKANAKSKKFGILKN
ncbi:hypothetical protein HWV00_18575 [Moritella sp. 24]|uniref:phospholipase D family protein n=1 Tax=Moritella sp. 24 TaxID=2746230 RepID=UPI001BACCF91|nr:phospholipase D family protein [Moritella sp. 24]QUM78056.1 hypothetical protein HWV00_18575 [Moritella sp. 24]